MVEHELVNRRSSSRVAIHMPATVTIASTDFDCVIENLSLGGAQVCCGLPVALGEKIGLFFVLVVLFFPRGVLGMIRRRLTS